MSKKINFNGMKLIIEMLQVEKETKKNEEEESGEVMRRAGSKEERGEEE